MKFPVFLGSKSPTERLDVKGNFKAEKSQKANREFVIKELSVWMDQLSDAQLPSGGAPPGVSLWHSNLSQVERDLVEAIGQAVWSLETEERNILYASCSESERQLIGICCLITEDSV